jgi:hypothetical protein
MNRVVAFSLTSVLAGAPLSGCGDNLPGGDGGLPPDARGDNGRFADPEDFSREGCEPGSLAGADLEGIYHLEADYGDGWTFPVVVRIDDLGGAGTGFGGAVAGIDATLATVDDNDAIVHFTAEAGWVRAVDLCARDADGTLRGWYGNCPALDDPDSECWSVPVEGKELERLDEPAASGLTLLGRYGAWPVGGGEGISVNVRVAGDLAYVARYQDGLRIVDVSDPASPTEVGHLATEFPDDFEIYNDVKLVDGPGGERFALMASNLVGVVVVDVTDPAAPEIVGHFGSTPFPGEPKNVHTLFVDGGKAYIAIRDYGLEIFDLADPRAPVRLGRFSPDGYLHDLYVSGDRAYLNFWELGMAIVDVSDPTQPVEVGWFSDYGEDSSHSNWVTEVGGRKIAVHGDEQWGAHVHIVDVTEGTGAFGTSIAEWETRPEVSVHNIMAFGDRAVLAHYQDGVRVLDLSDPAAPALVAHYNTWPGYDPDYGYSFFESAVGIDVDVVRGRIYVADSHRGLLILSID